MPNTRLFYLFELLRSGELSNNEREELLDLLVKDENKEEAKILIQMAWAEYKPKNPVFNETESTALFNKILTDASADHEPVSINREVKPLITWKRFLGYAAILLLIFSVSIKIFKNQTRQIFTASNEKEHSAKNKTEITSGKNKATLTLSDGTKIDLDDVSAGKIASKAGISIIKIADGQLVYTVTGRQDNTKDRNYIPEINTISTPRGTQYQINLPDGSKVWLNAESSLKFPVAFVGKERVVELTGEAYFEINSQQRDGHRMPFKVRSYIDGRSQEVEVLGTHFNIKSYANDAATKTTLIEGSVQITNLNLNKTNILLPGQQAIATQKNTQIAKANIEEVMAWKMGNFMFNNLALTDIMKQLERWYDMEVSYNHMPNSSYHGLISRKVTLAQVLEMLEMAGDLKFKITKSPTGKDKIEILKK
ncbi:FecR family protein [Pedobacter montanisoli]|uniref:DUF4974 domain-containing protein n=1 Tax=Pedobacter montanisoli TaxID=2923277 RepID=A0ABS9ZWA9_9SPHI|nr:FecR family protein [Pedobacter montanisoli]MCJ0742589.1 DUF4974 domain-containing protein [Pedobacter montanisoli]